MLVTLYPTLWLTWVVSTSTKEIVSSRSFLQARGGKSISYLPRKKMRIWGKNKHNVLQQIFSLSFPFISWHPGSNAKKGKIFPSEKWRWQVKETFTYLNIKYQNLKTVHTTGVNARSVHLWHWSFHFSVRLPFRAPILQSWSEALISSMVMISNSSKFHGQLYQSNCLERTRRLFARSGPINFCWWIMAIYRQEKS